MRQLRHNALPVSRAARILGYINWALVGASALAVFGLIHRDFMFGLILWWLVLVAIGQFAVHIVSVLETHGTS